MKRSLECACSGLVALALLGACSKEPTPVRRTEPWLASASASGSVQALRPSGLRRFVISPSESSIRFSLPGRKGKPSGTVPVLEGSLELDPSALGSARASISADLSRLELDPSSLPSDLELPGASPSALARQWLELGPEVPSERREEFGRALFELSSIEAVTPPALELDSVRGDRSRATALGSLLVHGFRAPVRVQVILQALPRTAGAPLRLAIRSATPLVLPLAPHEITARGPGGVAEPREAARAEGYVGRSVLIELELIAVPAP